MSIFDFFKSPHEKFEPLNPEQLEPIDIQEKIKNIKDLFKTPVNSPGLNEAQKMNYINRYNTLSEEFYRVMNLYTKENNPQILLDKLPAIKINVDNLYEDLIYLIEMLNK